MASYTLHITWYHTRYVSNRCLDRQGWLHWALMRCTVRGQFLRLQTATPKQHSTANEHRPAGQHELQAMRELSCCRCSSMQTTIIMWITSKSVWFVCLLQNILPMPLAIAMRPDKTNNLSPLLRKATNKSTKSNVHSAFLWQMWLAGRFAVIHDLIARSTSCTAWDSLTRIHIHTNCS